MINLYLIRLLVYILDVCFVLVNSLVFELSSTSLVFRITYAETVRNVRD